MPGGLDNLALSVEYRRPDLGGLTGYPRPNDGAGWCEHLMRDPAIGLSHRLDLMEGRRTP